MKVFIILLSLAFFSNNCSFISHQDPTFINQYDNKTDKPVPIVENDPCNYKQGPVLVDLLGSLVFAIMVPHNLFMIVPSMLFMFSGLEGNENVNICANKSEIKK
jgi:hypothetical protein